MMTERELFCAVLDHTPPSNADVIVVLSGDGTSRLDMAVNLFGRWAPKIVVSGGLANAPFSLDAPRMYEYLIGKGIAPDRITQESASLNTREQAVNVIALAKEHQWSRIIIVASHFHHYRAYLTFLRVLSDELLTHTIRLISAPVNVPWWEIPEGTSKSRIDLLHDEFAKIDTYRERGDVASYDKGLRYLRSWEGR